MKKVKLEIVGLSYSQAQTGAYALVLGETKGKRRLPIIIGGFEAQAIAIELEKMSPSRPLTHDLFKTFAETFKDKTDCPALILKTSSAVFSVIERESFRKKIKNILIGINNPPPIYLLFGDLTNKEMNDLYNHPKIKSMVSITKGEGFGRPLLEFTMTGKPVIASNWSGHKDFLSMESSVMIGGSLTEVDDSAVDNFILKGSKWIY